MIISVGAEKASKIPHLFIIKALNKLGTEGTQVSMMTSAYTKAIASTV